MINPEAAKQIRTRLLPYVPIWTGIMRPYFKRSTEIATSSSVEAEFSDLKNRGFKGQLPMRADKFIFQHLDFVDTKIMLTSNEKDIKSSKNSEQSLEKSIDLISIKNDDMEYDDKDDDKDNKDDKDDNDSTRKINLSNVSNASNVSNKSNASNESNASNVSNVFDVSNVNENDCMWSTYENWHGLVNPTNDMNEPDDIKKRSQKLPKPKKQYNNISYLDKCPEWDYLKHTKSKHSIFH